MSTMQTTDESHIEPHEPHWLSRSAFQIVIIFFFITEIALAMVLRSGASLWFAVPLVLLTAHFMHGAAVGFHEATHGLLRQNRRLNEFDGVLLGVFSFMSFSLYRAAHQLHHMHLATERDEELWPFVHPGMPRWVRVLAAVSELTLGLVFLPCLFLRIFLRTGSPIRSKKVRRRIWYELMLMVIVWSAVLGAVAHWHAWHYFVWMYLAPAWLAANLQSWRKYIEHVGLLGNTANSSTRSIVARGWLGRFVAFTLLHEPYHGLHHMHAGLPHAELPKLAVELQPKALEERPPFPSYTHALVDLFRSLANPRVGAQWRPSNSAPA
ncbi:fatty acid desaturase family protein [Prosthecobacter sp.]|uniref:fatty acid desaturase family protein n=1 Tax=Prosthecobacter sp. TaxID=1965333 RepID=UPI003782F579